MDNDADLIARMRFQLQREGLKSAVRGALSDGADRLSALAAERDKLRKLDEEAATYVETVICMRTGFTGEPPYVGWKGLGLALTEALDERDSLRAELERAREAMREIGPRISSFLNIISDGPDDSDVAMAVRKLREARDMANGAALSHNPSATPNGSANARRTP